MKITASVFAAAFFSYSLAFAAPTPPKHRISMKHAEQIATQVQTGHVEGRELEHENGQWVYSFDIRATDHMIHEVQVDARNGKIVSRTIETPQQEAAEAAGESKSP